MRYIYTQSNIIWALKRNEILIHATTYVNHEDAMLKKKVSHQKTKKRNVEGQLPGTGRGRECGDTVQWLQSFRFT